MGSVCLCQFLRLIDPVRNTLFFIAFFIDFLRINPNAYLIPFSEI